MPLQFLAIGLAAGVLSGLFGVGGGILIVPALILVAKMSQHTATGTSLGALLLPVGLLGAWQYYKAGQLDIHASLWIALGLLFGAWAGGALAQEISGPGLRRGFAVLLALAAVRLWFKN
jgi:uncharacterized membrane protein YfcA